MTVRCDADARVGDATMKTKMKLAAYVSLAALSAGLGAAAQAQEATQLE